ncbi:MAG TPA: BMP family protein [Pusillimonas sp.]|uniref:BMP family protein n=1 Tax=unclassified Pusillimonas TaxID=2640016 RepID=UPI00261191D2|nr:MULTISPECIES: BMP family protein [unclassified Pusillimonas]HLU19208.1 BMP family protein [Pusillimonas sp.]
MLRRLLCTLCLAVLPFTVTAQDKSNLKVALILPGSVTDGTFNSAAAAGIKKAQEKYPGIQVSIRENTDVAQAQEALTSYAHDGYDVVIAHGFQFADPAKRIHKRFPNTWFIVNTTKVAAAPNLASFDNRWGDAGYMAGAVAALMSKSGKIANVPAIPVPTIQEYDEGFKNGSKRINPDIEVMSAYVGSFSDIAKAKEITTSMIDSGADVVSGIGNENVLGTLQAAKEKGALMIGTAFDSAALAPDTIVTTALINFDVNIDMAIGKIIDGTIEPKNYLLGLNEEGIGLAPLRNFEGKLSDKDKAAIKEIQDGIRAGTIDDLPEIREKAN